MEIIKYNNELFYKLEDIEDILEQKIGILKLKDILRNNITHLLEYIIYQNNYYISYVGIYLLFNKNKKYTELKDILIKFSKKCNV